MVIYNKGYYMPYAFADKTQEEKIHAQEAESECEEEHDKIKTQDNSPEVSDKNSENKNFALTLSAGLCGLQFEKNTYVTNQDTLNFSEVSKKNAIHSDEKLIVRIPVDIFNQVSAGNLKIPTARGATYSGINRSTVSEKNVFPRDDKVIVSIPVHVFNQIKDGNSHPLPLCGEAFPGTERFTASEIPGSDALVEMNNAGKKYHKISVGSIATTVDSSSKRKDDENDLSWALRLIRTTKISQLGIARITGVDKRKFAKSQEWKNRVEQERKVKKPELARELLIINKLTLMEIKAKTGIDPKQLRAMKEYNPRKPRSSASAGQRSNADITDLPIISSGSELTLRQQGEEPHKWAERLLLSSKLSLRRIHELTKINRSIMVKWPIYEIRKDKDKEIKKRRKENLANARNLMMMKGEVSHREIVEIANKTGVDARTLRLEPSYKPEKRSRNMAHMKKPVIKKRRDDDDRILEIKNRIKEAKENSRPSLPNENMLKKNKNLLCQAVDILEPYGRRLTTLAMGIGANNKYYIASSSTHLIPRQREWAVANSVTCVSGQGHAEETLLENNNARRITHIDASRRICLDCELLLATHNISTKTEFSHELSLKNRGVKKTVGPSNNITSTPIDVSCPSTSLIVKPQSNPCNALGLDKINIVKNNLKDLVRNSKDGISNRLLVEWVQEKIMQEIKYHQALDILEDEHGDDFEINDFITAWQQVGRQLPKN
jgi:hypothetical protein